MMKIFHVYYLNAYLYDNFWDSLQFSLSFQGPLKF